MKKNLAQQFLALVRHTTPALIAISTALWAMPSQAQTVPSSPIVGGKDFSCVRTSAGGVKCWGTNVQGQLGDGTFVDKLTPVDVVGLTSGVTAIATGERHACALLDTGGVKCWGEDKFGQLGDGVALVGGGGPDRNTPVTLLGLPLGTIVVGIAAGRSHTCAVTSTGGAKCWGLNGDGQLGNGAANSSLPLDVTGLATNVRAIFSNAGAIHTCAILNTGSDGNNTRCWGANRTGQLGNGTTSTSPTNVPAVVTGLVGAVSLTLGDVHTCARTAAGGAKCWGDNLSGQLGDGTIVRKVVPTDVLGLNGVIEIAAGGTNSFFTCARTLSGSMSCWGQGKNGQLGDGTSTPARSIPAQVSNLGNSVVAISAMTDFACALTSTGYKCWGVNFVGQLGTGTATVADVLAPGANIGGIPLTDAFPVGGQLPAGWSKPASATATWVVDAATAGEGLMSLRSQPIGDNQTACTEFTSPLATGSVTFRRRVSSEAGSNDKFSVSVDGVEVPLSVVSGNVSWASASVPVVVGLRTIRFCYTKNTTLNDFADGAWIDDVKILEACAPGTFSANGSLPCTPASPGNFVAEVGATAQTPCAAGTFSPTSGATACTPASPGSFVPTTGATSQTLCAAGSFSSTPGATVCTLASPGSFVATAGASVQTFCAAGSFSSTPGAVSCTLAGLGFFVPTPGATSQTACGIGTTTLVTGATACSPIILTVTPSAGANGSITPNVPQSVTYGNTANFTVTPNAGFVATVASGGANCGGTLVGTTYTTTTITASCAVAATFIERCVPGSFSATGNAPCTLASPGSFVPVAGATSQTLCAAGSFSAAAGATACTLASPGSFVGATGATSQTLCATGSFSAAAGATACTPASPGSFVATTGATAQTLCSAGSFSAAAGATACTPASPGSFVAGAGASAPTLCAAGSFSSAPGATSCTLAALGFFVPNPGATSQTACAVGTTTLVTGATSCSPIILTVTPSAGANGTISPNVPQSVTFGNTASFTITPNAGFVANVASGAGNCGGNLVGTTYTTATITASCDVAATFIARCVPGSFSATGNAPCTLASPGSFVATTGATSQTQCAAGTFSAAAGAVACTPASPGSFVAATGATAQTLCAAGSFSSAAGAISCTPASPGSFVATTGATAQTLCSAGSFSAAAGATACAPASPGSFVAAAGATAQTLCAAGSFSAVAGATACTPASPGSFVAAAGATSQALCAAGSFSSAPGATSCTLAALGFFVSNPGATSQTACAVGTTTLVVGATSCTAIILTVTPTAGANGSITPNVPQSVTFGNTTTFTVTPNAGFVASVANGAGNCGGTLVGTTYTTAAITASCNVAATFIARCVPGSFSATGNAPCTLASPGSFVATTGATSQTLCAAGSFSSAPGATSCTLAGLGFFVPTPGATSQTACAVGTTTLVTGATSCTAIILTVTPSAGANGAITPNTPQSVTFGNTTTFTITPNAGFVASVATGAGNCGGNLVGTTYTTATITASCDVAATFIARCVPGSFSATGNAPCTLASPGSFVASTGATSQTQCAAGTFSAAAGATACTPASPGSFVGIVGASAQTLCAAGSFSSAPGATSCTLAALGFFVPTAGATSQTACATGTTTLVTGATVCVPIVLTVTPSAGANGAISPNAPQSVTFGATANFAITPNTGYVASVATGAGNCGGTLSGTTPNLTFATDVVVANCNVAVSFVPLVVYDIVLQGAQEVPPVSPAGSGTAHVTVDTVNNVISWTISFTGLTSAFSAAHFHGPAARGVPAGVKIPISGTTSPLTGSAAYLEADEAAIIGGLWYVNIHTANNPGGEIRGQLDNLGPILPAAKPNDLNGDGKSDIVYKDALGAISAVLLNGVASTATANILPAGTGWSVTHIADFDGDGKADLLIKNIDGRIAILLMNGTSVLNFAQLVGAGTGYTPAVTGDFNRDGKADIVLQNADGSAAVLLMNGGTVLNASFVLSAGSPWTVTHAGDFDGDGKTDLILKNTDGSAAILIMNGVGVTSAGLLLGGGSPWSVSHVADLSGDGKADIIIKNTDGSAVMLLMNGTTATSAAYLLTPGSPYSITHVGDFNGDGKADLLIRNVDGSVVMLQMNGIVVSTATFLLVAGATSTVAQIADYNGDGKSDILLRNADGSATVILMNGGVVTAAGNVWGAGTLVAVP